MSQEDPFSLGNRINIRNSTGLFSLFSVDSQLETPSTRMYYSGSTYSSGSTPPSLRKYASSSSYRETPTSSYYSSSSSNYRSPYSSTTSSTFYSRSSSRPFTSRFLKNRYLSSSDDESAENEDPKRHQNDDDAAGRFSGTENDSVVVEKTTGLNGAVIRIRHRREVSTSDDEEEEKEETETLEEPEKDPTPEPEPEEDPLDVEERELNSKLMLSLTLTLVDEENVRQRLLEIRKTRLRQRERDATEIALVQKFQKVADVSLFENQTISSKQEEEKALIQRLSAASLSDVDRKDAHVRLQEIFRDQRNALDKSLRDVELHYEHILQETSTELTELETSIRNKAEQVEKLQEEMLVMSVRKELLSRGMEQVNESHSERVCALNSSISKIETKMSDFAVIVVQSPSTTSMTSVNAECEISIARAEELRELERELECPVCMDISHPPIYQCEEGHIICSNCKPLLTNCPHNCGQRYSEPAIRCRFAEKLAERYFKTIMKLRKESTTTGEK